MAIVRLAPRLCRVGCDGLRVSYFHASMNLLQRRGLATHRDAAYEQTPYEKGENVGDRKYSHFDIGGKVFVVTGGGQGLGFSIAEGLVEAGGFVHVLDRLSKPTKEFEEARARAKSEYDGRLEYHQADVTNADVLGKTIGSIAAQKQRLDGLVAAAAIQQCTKAIDYKSEDVAKMLAVNYTGVLLTAQACAREMLKYKVQGSMCLVASMSGSIANRGLDAPVYNSSKAAVIQLAQNLAMEFGRKRKDGSGSIRVNSLSPGHIIYHGSPKRLLGSRIDRNTDVELNSVHIGPNITGPSKLHVDCDIITPMVEENFRRGEADRAEWEDNTMLGRISTPEEYKAVALFMLRKASSYMTGHDLKVDGGTSAW